MWKYSDFIDFAQAGLSNSETAGLFLHTTISTLHKE